MSSDRHEARIVHIIQADGAPPQFGHAGRHRGNGAADCPRELHHHHDHLCAAPTPAEWAEAGRSGPIEVTSRA